MAREEQATPAEERPSRYELTRGEIEAAREWWRTLPDKQKAHWSIWNLLALYARHVLDGGTDELPDDDDPED